MNVFKPIELTEENFDKVYKVCMVNEFDVSSDIYEGEIFIDSKSDEGKVRFSKRRLEANRKIFYYMMGQFDVIHHPKALKMYALKNVNDKYTKEPFTNNVYRQIAMIHIAIYFKCCSPLLVVDGDYFFHSLDVDITPTLSPSDPAFDDWWKKHKKDWEN